MGEEGPSPQSWGQGLVSQRSQRSLNFQDDRGNWWVSLGEGQELWREDTGVQTPRQPGGHGAELIAGGKGGRRVNAFLGRGAHLLSGG